MSPRQNAKTDYVDVFLSGGLGHELRRLIKTGIDYLEASVAKQPGDDPDSRVMPVQADFSQEHPARYS